MCPYHVGTCLGKCPPSHTRLQGRGQQGSVKVPGSVMHGRRLTTRSPTASLPARLYMHFSYWRGKTYTIYAERRGDMPRTHPSYTGDASDAVPQTADPHLLLQPVRPARRSYWSEMLSLSATVFKGWRQNKGKFKIDKTATRTPNVRAQDKQHLACTCPSVPTQSRSQATLPGPRLREAPSWGAAPSSRRCLC